MNLCGTPVVSARSLNSICIQVMGNLAVSQPTFVQRPYEGVKFFLFLGVFVLIERKCVGSFCDREAKEVRI